MHWALVLASAAALAGAHILRFPRPSTAALAAFAFLAGLAVMAFGLRIGADALGFGRVTDFDRIVNRAVDIAKRDPSPLLVFAGTSHSRTAIDDARLTLSLRAQGLSHRAINLSLEAASADELHTHLEALMDRSGRVPDAVFIEIADSVAPMPASVMARAPFSPRAIEHFDPAAAYQAGRALREAGCATGLDCLRLQATLAAHAALNALNIGLLSSGAVEAEVGDRPLRSAAGNPQRIVSIETRTDGLSLTIGAQPEQAPPWVSGPRTRNRTMLHNAGVRTVGYYLPPVIDPDIRTRAAGLCVGELQGLPCIPPTDPTLLSRLDAPVWLDDSHLLDIGAGIYGRWLAREIAPEVSPERTLAQSDEPDGGALARALP
ncbi:MAG: hypothetical protein AAFQ18_10345 [Pseudomonadota bacterium]